MEEQVWTVDYAAEDHHELEAVGMDGQPSAGPHRFVNVGAFDLIVREGVTIGGFPVELPEPLMKVHPGYELSAEFTGTRWTGVEVRHPREGDQDG